MSGFAGCLIKAHQEHHAVSVIKQDFLLSISCDFLCGKLSLWVMLVLCMCSGPGMLLLYFLDCRSQILLLLPQSDFNKSKGFYGY